MTMLWWVALAGAADWAMLQGTEVGQPEAPVRPWGFVQAVGEGVFAQPVEGLVSETLLPFEGEVASFNRLGSGDATWGFNVRRARLGLRGAVPRTDGDVAWLVAVEAGNNALTRADRVVLTDASVTLSYVPYLRLRVGQFKLPTMDETLEANPIAAESINYSQAASQLMMENPIADGAYTGGGSGFRDLGVQAFDTLPLGPVDVGYAVMLSNGRPGAVDTDTPKDVTARLALTRVLGGEVQDPHRPELSVFAWHQEGRRQVDGEEARRMRQGAGVHLETAPVRARAEVVRAVGTVETGASPPFAGQPLVVDPDGVALGAYAMVHGEWKGAGATVRWDQLWRGYGAEADLRVFRTFTFGLEYAFSPRARVMVDYELRRLAAPHASADVQTIAATMGDRLSGQVVAFF